MENSEEDFMWMERDRNGLTRNAREKLICRSAMRSQELDHILWGIGQSLKHEIHLKMKEMT